MTYESDYRSNPVVSGYSCVTAMCLASGLAVILSKNETRTQMPARRLANPSACPLPPPITQGSTLVSSELATPLAAYLGCLG